MSSGTQPIINEKSLILIVGLIQFVNILDFMMVMPLGPDFARALGIPAHEIGIIGGAYTFAAAIAGLLAAVYIDQFARKKVALVCLFGLSVATFAGALAWNRESMLAVRLLAGMFGGPLTSMSQSLIADYIPPERRGRAMGKVAGAFAAASVLGVPFGLELASRFSWHAPFIVTGILGCVVLLLAYLKLPYHKPYTQPFSMRGRLAHFAGMLASKRVQLSYIFMGLTMMAGFMIVPNISAHVQINLGYPREHLGMLYFCGGLVSFFGMRMSGWITDKTSSTVAICMFSASLIIAVFLGFVWYGHGIPVLAIFILFMVSMTGRMVAVQTLTSKIPAPQERGAYMSVQSSITHMSSALGAYYSSVILVDEGNALLHMPTVGLTAIGISCIVPLLVWRVERMLKR